MYDDIVKIHSEIEINGQTLRMTVPVDPYLWRNATAGRRESIKQNARTEMSYRMGHLLELQVHDPVVEAQKERIEARRQGDINRAEFARDREVLEAAGFKICFVCGNIEVDPDNISETELSPGEWRNVHPLCSDVIGLDEGK